MKSKHIRRCEFLYKNLPKDIKPEWNILELGCNAGRNLNYLFEKGYKNLTGIEISQQAIELMARKYPECAASITVIKGAIENTIAFSDNYSDLTITMAVLEHIHPDSEFIFDEIIRISKYLLIIEDETTESWRHVPRNYEKIFSKGMKMISSIEAKESDGFNYGYVLRLFSK